MGNVETTLKLTGDIIVELVRAEIVAKGKRATGELYNSVESKIEKTPNSLAIGIYANFYFNVINEGWKANGLKGQTPSLFLDNLTRWVLLKGKESNIKAARSAAWAIRNHIFKNGIPAVDLLSPVIKEIENQLTPDIFEAIQKDIEQEMQNMLNKYR